MNSSALICLLLLLKTPDCATAATPPSPSPAAGELIVYSTTYSSTVEQSEYPTHTNYTIATSGDKIIEHVDNATGTFNSRPAKVPLPAGEYHVRAQYYGGRFITVHVRIEPQKTTVVDLDGEPISHGRAAAREMIRLPDGQVVGWSATSSGTFTAS
jgi:hypothetical protein